MCHGVSECEHGQVSPQRYLLLRLGSRGEVRPTPVENALEQNSLGVSILWPRPHFARTPLLHIVQEKGKFFIWLASSDHAA